MAIGPICKIVFMFFFCLYKVIFAVFDLYLYPYKTCKTLISPGAAIICPLILTLDPRRGPIGDLKKTLGRHSRCGAERCNSRWHPICL